MTTISTIGQSDAAARVRAAIASASASTGIDFDYLYQQAKVESGLRPTAKAKTSSATGLYQFTQQTWLATVKTHGRAHGLAWAADAISQSQEGRFTVADASLRADILDLRNSPEAASLMAAEFASDNAAYLSPKLGRPLEPVDLYLAHFLGPVGAAKFLSAHAAAPDATAAPLFESAAGANRDIFFAADGRARSLDEIRSSFDAKLGGQGREALGATAHYTYQGQQAHQGLRSPWQARQQDFDGTSSDGPRPMALLAIEPMPERLSLEFARRAYRRLSALGEGADA